MPIQPALLLLAAAGLALAVGLRAGRHPLRFGSNSARPTCAQAALVGLLVGAAVVLAHAGLAVAFADTASRPPWERLWSAQVLAAVCVATTLVCFRRDPANPWQLPAIGLAALVPWASAGLPLEWAEGAQPARVTLGLIAAALCSVILSARRRDQLMQLARSAAMDATGDSILVVDAAGGVLQANANACEALAIPAVESRRGFFAAAPAVCLPESLRVLLSDPVRHQIVLKSASDRVFEAWISESDLRRPLKGIRAMVVRDVTDRRRDEHQLVRLAHYDSLTGLANRRFFIDQLGQSLRDAKERDDLAAVFYIDLDRFKETNDSLGHAAGDELLRALARRLQNNLDKQELMALGMPDGLSAFVSRLAGDEFAIAITGFSGPDVVARVAERILELAGRPVQLSNSSMITSASVGIALFPRDGIDVETLFKHADIALYAAKRRGRNRFVFYESGFNDAADRTRSIEQGLRKAIEGNELRLHYQPKIDLRSQTVVGFEALLRWTSPDLGPVGPKDFIPVAEDRGLITEIGSWCIEETCRQLASWRDAGLESVPISVNVSSVQFSETELPTLVGKALQNAGLEPQMLELELTESLLLTDDERTAVCLRDLRAMGIQIALDDFGTGYSALTYLNRFPLDVLKMDRGFIRDIAHNSEAAGIASAVVSMAHSLGLCVIAEGIDSEDQLEPLRVMGCDQLQGFLYAAALPPDEVERFLARAGERAPVIEPHQHAPGTLPAPPSSEAAELEPPADGPAMSSNDEKVSEAEREPPLAPKDSVAEARRVLIIDDDERSLGTLALRLGQMGVDLHYASFADEAHLFIKQEKAAIRLLMVSPSFDFEKAKGILDHLAMESRTSPPFIVVGEEPDEDVRAHIRAAGVTWVLWSPFDDTELRFMLNSALALPEELSRRHDTRIPADSMVWIRAGDQREVGVMSSISARGAFIEMSVPLPVGTLARLEFELSADRFRMFARVIYRQEEDASLRDCSSSGIGVLFYDVDRVTERTLRTLIEPLAARYFP